MSHTAGPDKTGCLLYRIFLVYLGNRRSQSVPFASVCEIPAIVLDIPLLVELGWEKRCDKLIFVDCREKIRAERAKKMGILTESELRNREKFQKQLDSKAALADNIINNNFGYIGLARQVAKIFSFMVENE